MKKLVMGIALFLACVAPARADEPQPEDAALRTGTFTLGPLHVDRKYNPTRTIDAGRRRRIASGAGVDPSEVSGLIKQFDGMAQLMTKMATMGMRDRMKAIGDLQRGGMMNPGASLAREKQGTGKRLTAEERKKLAKQREKEMRKKKRDQRK